MRYEVKDGLGRAKKIELATISGTHPVHSNGRNLQFSIIFYGRVKETIIGPFAAMADAQKEWDALHEAMTNDPDKPR